VAGCCEFGDDPLCSGATEFERSWIYLQVAFNSFFFLTELLNMAVLQNVEVMLVQTPNYFV
jgi:hypothetical protein